MGSCCGCTKDNEPKEANNGQTNENSNSYKWDSMSYTPKAIASSPSRIATNELTIIYELPSKQFRTEEDVFIAHGYQILNEIAKGGFGKVYKARRLSDGTVIACKIIDLTEDIDQKHRTDTKSELFVLERTSHPNIIKLFQHFMIRSRGKICVYIWMQFATEDSLSKYMRETPEPIAETLAKRMFAQIVAAVRHMHQKGIAHRDLKMGNILLGHSMNILVSDFGLSRVAYRVSKGGTIMSSAYCGTVPYMAPEILMNRVDRKQEYNPFIADVWAMGIILYIICNKAYPFDENNGFHQMIESQLKRKWKFSRFIKSKPSAQLYHVLKALLEPDCDKRITIAQLAKHQWIIDEIKSIPL